MSDKKYVSLDRLVNYDALIKAEIVEGDTNAVSSAVNTSKSYTNSEINKLKDGTTTVAKATSATSATSATKATQDGNGKTISSTYETKTDASSKLAEAKEYTDTSVGDLSEGFENVIFQMYGSDISEEGAPTIRAIATEEADTALASAKSYTDTKTSGLASTSVVDSKISTHDTSTSAHSDIRGLITALTTKLNNFLDVDDTTSDQLSEVLTLIENNKGTLESLTTSKVNVSDIIDNLTTSSTSKVLSAKQGVAIKSLIDTLQAELDSHGHEISDISGLQSALDDKAASGHTHSYAGSSSVGGAATSANKINTDAGNATNPVYFSNGIPVKTTYTLNKSVPSNAVFTDTTYDVATTSDNGLMSSADKTKLNYTNVAYGTCSTAAATAAKVVVINGNSNWALTIGSMITVKFTETNTAANPTLNVNSTGAYPIYYNATEYTSSSSYGGYANRHITYQFDGTYWVFISWSYDSNSDTKVQQNAAITTAGEYPVLLAYSTATSKITNAVQKTSSLKYNPNTKILTAPTFKGALTGNADTATALSSSAGSATQPVYFSGGKPVATTYTLETSVPSGAKFTDTTYSNATPSAAGLMSAADKTKLDDIATGANKTTVDSALSSSSTNPVQNKVVNSALAGKVPTTRTVNSKALSADITLSAEDVGAMADTGGTFSNWAHRIEKSDVAGRLISARDRAITRTTAGHATSFCCGTSLKTVNGTWDVGTTADNLYFNYATDTNFNAGTNSVLTGLRITETGAVVLAAGSFGSTLPSTGVKGQIFFKI